MLHAISPPRPIENLPIVTDLKPFEVSNDDFNASVLNLNMGKFGGCFSEIVLSDISNMPSSIQLQMIHMYDDSIGSQHEESDILISSRNFSQKTFYSKIIRYSLYGYIHHDKFIAIGFISGACIDGILARLIVSKTVDVINNTPFYDHKFHKKCNIVYTGNDLFMVYAFPHKQPLVWEVTDILIWDRYHYGSPISDWFSSSSNVSFYKLTVKDV